VEAEGDNQRHDGLLVCVCAKCDACGKKYLKIVAIGRLAKTSHPSGLQEHAEFAILQNCIGQHAFNQALKSSNSVTAQATPCCGMQSSGEHAPIVNECTSMPASCKG